MPLDPRRQQELQAWQQKAQTGALSDKQNLRMNYLQNRMGRPAQPNQPNMGGQGQASSPLIPRNQRINGFQGAMNLNQNVQNQQAQDNLRYNNPVFNGIGGGQSTSIDPNTGQPVVNQWLSPDQQNLYNTENQFSQEGLKAALGMLGNPQDFNRQQIEDSVFNNLTRSINQDKTRDQKALEESLVARGIPVGSEAYNSATAQFNQRYDDLTTAARDRATQFGGEEMSRRADIINKLGQVGPGLRTPNMPAFQGPQVDYGNVPQTDLLYKSDRREGRKSRAEIEALRRVGKGGGGGSRGPSQPESPFYA